MDVKSISIIGCGWLGRPLALTLMKEGWSVKGTASSVEKVELLRQLGVDAYPFKASGQEWEIPVNVLNSQVLFLNLPPGRRGGKAPYDFIALHQEILGLLESEVIEHLVFISSTGVYANTERKVGEDSKIEPTNASAEVLYAVEEQIKNLTIPFTILRLAGLAGGERQPGRWFAGKKNIPGGDTPVNMIHREDCINAILKCINANPTNRVYNLCADLHPPKSQFYKEQAAKLGLEIPDFDPGSVPFKIVVNMAFKKQFDYVFKYPDPISF